MPDESAESPARLMYTVLDHGSGPRISESLIVHTCGNWIYWRCPHTGLEWHTNGMRGFWYDNEASAWWSYFTFKLIELESAVRDALNNKTGSFPRIVEATKRASKAAETYMRLKGSVDA